MPGKDIQYNYREYWSPIVTRACKESGFDWRNVLGASATAIVPVAVEWVFTGTFDLWILAVSAVAGSILWGWKFASRFMQLPVEDHQHLAAQLEKKKAAEAFADLLRGRQRSIERISLEDRSEESLKKARGELVANQVEVIRLLNRKDSAWTGQPCYWSPEVDPEQAWAGLGAVLQSRYPGEIKTLLSLFDDRRTDESGDKINLHITLQNFGSVKNHAIEYLDLLIREVVQPDRHREPEPPMAFLHWQDHLTHGRERSQGEFSVFSFSSIPSPSPSYSAPPTPNPTQS